MACFCPIQVQEGEVGVSMFCGKFVSTPCVLLFAAATPELVQLVYRTEPYHQAATSTVGDISPASNTPRGSDTVRRKNSPDSDPPPLTVCPPRQALDRHRYHVCEGEASPLFDKSRWPLGLLTATVGVPPFSRRPVRRPC